MSNDVMTRWKILCPACRGKGCAACQETGTVWHIEFHPPSTPRRETDDTTGKTTTVQGD